MKQWRSKKKDFIVDYLYGLKRFNYSNFEKLLELKKFSTSFSFRRHFFFLLLCSTHFGWWEKWEWVREKNPNGKPVAICPLKSSWKTPTFCYTFQTSGWREIWICCYLEFILCRPGDEPGRRVKVEKKWVDPAAVWPACLTRPLRRPLVTKASIFWLS